MFSFYGGLKDIVPVLEQLTRLPGRLLVQFSGFVSALLTILGYFVARQATTFFGWIPLIVGIFYLLVTVTFALRRYQLGRAVDQWMHNEINTLDAQSKESGTDYSDLYAGQKPSDSHDVVVLNEDGTPFFADGNPTRSVPVDDTQAQRLHDARMESEQRRDTWLPGIEAAQRAAIAAAGGTVNAPYLKPDLRITLLSAVLTMALTPVGIFFVIVALFSLL